MILCDFYNTDNQQFVQKDDVKLMLKNLFNFVD